MWILSYLSYPITLVVVSSNIPREPNPYKAAVLVNYRCIDILLNVLTFYFIFAPFVWLLRYVARSSHFSVHILYRCQQWLCLPIPVVIQYMYIVILWFIYSYNIYICMYTYIYIYIYAPITSYSICHSCGFYYCATLQSERNRTQFVSGISSSQSKHYPRGNWPMIYFWRINGFMTRPYLLVGQRRI